jgi:hypothetical protein
MDDFTRIRVSPDDDLLIRTLTPAERGATLGGGLNLRAVALVPTGEPSPTEWLTAHSTVRVGMLVIALKPMVSALIGRHLLSFVGKF